MPELNALARLSRQIVPKNAPPAERQREESLRRYAPLVKYVVDRIATSLPKSIEKDDLVNTAIIGLFDALEKYDPDRGTKFETYAIWRIKGAVLDELRSLDWVSRTTRRKAKHLERVCCMLDQKLGRAAKETEIAKEMGLTLHELLRLIEEVRGSVVLSLDQAVPVDEDHDLTGLADMIEDDDSPNALAKIEEDENKKLLLQAINNLSEQERLVVALYYYEEMTLKEIGETLMISESRVSQIHTKAILRLRGRMHKTLLG
jgi:RNA polymerase sigma factor for flagellar operon FliA